MRRGILALIREQVGHLPFVSELDRKISQALFEGQSEQRILGDVLLQKIVKQRFKNQQGIPDDLFAYPVGLQLSQDKELRLFKALYGGRKFQQFVSFLFYLY